MALSITQQSLEIVAQNKDAQDLIHRGQLQPIVNDIANIILTAGTGGGAGNVVGSGTSVAGTLPLVNNLTTTAIIPSLVAATAAGSLTIPAGQSITTPKVQAVASTNLSLLTNSGGKIILNDNANIAGSAVGLDMTGMGGYIGVKAGLVTEVAIGWSGGTGLYAPAANEIGFAISGSLLAKVNSTGVLMDSISELTLSNGVVFHSFVGIGTSAPLTVALQVAGNIEFKNGVGGGMDTLLGLTNIGDNDGFNNSTWFAVDDDAQIFSFNYDAGGKIQVNGADTYTGTLAGAAGKSVVNGLIMN